MNGWRMWVPPESQAAGCSFSPMPSERLPGKMQAALESRDPARFGILPDTRGLRVVPGERYRLTAWVKADASFKAEPGTPGVVLRATLFEFPGKDFPGGHIFAGFKGVAIGDPTPLAGAPPPREWAKIEATIEIPDGVTHLIYFVFVWRASGRLWVDDVSIVRVPRSSPVTTAIR